MSFTGAYARSDFIRPLAALSDHGGDESWTVGTFAVVNPEGWIVTTAHYLDEFDKARRADKGLRWWGWPDAELVERHVQEDADLLVGRLAPFEADRVATYPRFRTDWHKSRGYVIGEPVAVVGTGHNFTRHPFCDHEAREFVRPDPAPRYTPFLTDGVVSWFTDEVVATTCRSFPRICGAPILDRLGDVWGIVHRTLVRTDTPYKGPDMTTRFTAGIHPQVVTDVLDDLGVAYRSAGWWSDVRLRALHSLTEWG